MPSRLEEGCCLLVGCVCVGGGCSYDVPIQTLPHLTTRDEMVLVEERLEALRSELQAFKNQTYWVEDEGGRTGQVCGGRGRCRGAGQDRMGQVGWGRGRCREQDSTGGRGH